MSQVMVTNIVIGGQEFSWDSYRKLSHPERKAYYETMKDRIRLLSREEILTRPFTLWERVDRMILNWEENCASPIERLKDALETHDWYFAMSDDMRWFSAGANQRRRIKAMAEEIGLEGIALFEQELAKHSGA